MPLLTTVVGSYPKPSWLKAPDWFRTGHDLYDPCLYEKYLDSNTKVLMDDFSKATAEVIQEQEALGLDIITDGEVTRDNYVYHFCRSLVGVNLRDTVLKAMRNNAVSAHTAVIDGKLSLRNTSDVVTEWKAAQQKSAHVPLKYTLPGPVTIANTVHDKFYGSNRELCFDLAHCLNKQILDLLEAGCKHIQLDEPCFARLPEVALDYGIDLATKCFEGVGDKATTIVHICCGYPPNKAIADRYQKAELGAYMRIADKLDEAGFDYVSLEDANRPNDLELFDKFKKTGVILGVLKIANDVVETPEEIKERVDQVLEHIDAERLVLAPDCGLAFLDADCLKAKLENMVRAAHMY